MRQARRHYEMDMTSGPLLGKILTFSLPLMLSGILQLLYNAADIVVVGRFAGSVAMAAVGSNGALINLIVNLFIGLSVGASVVASKYYGAQDYKGVRETLHTSIAVSLVAGVVVALVGVTMARTFLHMMGTPEDVIDQAALYLQIFFIGMPAAMVYNFGAAILRAVGDTRRPLYYLSISGAVNVALNLLFVIVFHMGVAGVAIATVISQVISAVLVMVCLCRSSGCLHFRWQEMRVNKKRLLEITRIGLPAGLQSATFSISNVLIQSSINSFGSTIMAGNTAASNIDGFVNTAMSAICQAALSFAGQNMGAKQYRRVGQVVKNCVLLVAGLGVSVGLLTIFAGPTLLSLYTDEAQVIEMGMLRLKIMCATYVLCGLMDTFACTLRGMGYSSLPMLVTVGGVCGIRIVWIYTVFAADRTLNTLYLSYPVSWLVTLLIHALCFFVLYRRLLKRPDAPQPQ